MPNDYDKILRDNFREPKAALLRQLVTGNITKVHPLVPKLQRTLEREPDTVAEVQTEDGRHFIVHIEWQSTNDPAMASRMALYDLLLNQTYKREVLGAVLYLGNDPLRMKNVHTFFDFRYQCRMTDVRLLDPETFLSSDDAGEVLFAVLAGNSNMEEKGAIIRRIFIKLQQLLAADPALLRVKVKQLEILSLLRGKLIQEQIIKEENKMPVTIDIRQDLRYQQGREEGKEEEKEKTAEKMLQNGIAITLVQNITGLPMSKLEEITKRVAASSK